MSTFVTGDTAKDFTATLTNGPDPANLAGASVEVHFRTPSGILSKTATIDNAAAGTIRCAWAVDDLSDARGGGPAWKWEAQVTFSNGKIQTFPGKEFTVSKQIA